MTFTQLTARLKNFLRGWRLILGLQEGLVECATVCVKSEVMLNNIMLKLAQDNLLNQENLSRRYYIDYIHVDFFDLHIDITYQCNIIDEKKLFIFSDTLKFDNLLFLIRICDIVFPHSFPP